MIDRRQLIAGTLAGGVALAVPAPLLAAAQAKPPSRFVFDGRFAAAVREAAGWRRRGVVTLDTRAEDLGRMWRALARGSVPVTGVAGMTLWTDSYICETFGRDHGLSIDRASLDGGQGLLGWVLG